MADQQFRLIACPSLSHERRTDRYCATGRTVGDYLHELGWNTEGLHARVTIDGALVPDAEWQHVKPRAGQSVVVRTIFQGGGGNGQGGKQAAQIATMLALTVAAIYLGTAAGAARFAFLGTDFLGIAGLKTGAILGAGLLVSGSLAMNVRIPTPLPRRALTGAP